ncbi:MAG: glycosyltransferase [Thermoplasmata archaeon]
MKVYFSVIGLGLGHIARCLSIANELREEGIECVFSSYGKAAELAKKEGFKTYDSRDLMWYQHENGRIDFEMTLLKSPLIFGKMMEHFKSEYARVNKEDPDLVISDSRYSIIPASGDLDIPRLYITNQPKILMPKDENGKKKILARLGKIGTKFNYKLLSGQDKVLLPDFPLPYSISEKHMRMDDAPEKFKKKTEFVGPIAPHRPNGASSERVEEVCEKFDVSPGDFIYVAFSGPGEVKKEINEAIYKLFPDYDIPVVMGTGKPGDFKMHRKGNLRLIDGWIEEREELMEAADLVMSRAGLCTLSEIAAFGKKSVIIPQPNQPEQESNAEGVEKLGFGKKLDPKNTCEKTLSETLEEVRTSKEIKRSAKKWRKKCDQWKGEKRSAEIVLDHLETH